MMMVWWWQWWYDDDNIDDDDSYDDDADGDNNDVDDGDLDGDDDDNGDEGDDGDDNNLVIQITSIHWIPTIGSTTGVLFITSKVKKSMILFSCLRTQVSKEKPPTQKWQNWLADLTCGLWNFYSFQCLMLIAQETLLWAFSFSSQS